MSCISLRVCMIGLLSLCVVASAHTHSHRQPHECVHDKLNISVRQQHVLYKNHPFDILQASPELFETPQSRRRLVDETAFEPIRIRPYYDPASISTSNGLSEADILFIKQLTSASIRYLESFVRVIPVDGPLFISDCGETFYTSNFTMWSLCTQYTSHQRGLCGDNAVVPDDHLMQTWVRNSDQTTTLAKDAGAGISDADLIIYVTFGDHSGCEANTLAYASSCSKDQYGRPVAGYVTFCTSILEGKFWKEDIVTTLHEMTHILAMSSSVFPFFYDLEAGAFKKDPVMIQGNFNWLTTEAVTQVAREHFGCPTLIGAPLENGGGDGTMNSHWESQHLNFEYMIGTQATSQVYVSKFTLAMLEDSGWYRVDHDYAGDVFSFGQNSGCEFFNDDAAVCDNWSQWYCSSPGAQGCSADNTAIAYCASADGSGTFYCDYFTTYTYPGGGDVSDFEKLCVDERGNTYDSDSVGASTYGIDSRCVPTTRSGGATAGYCFQHTCADWDATNLQWTAVDITVGTGQVVRCARTDALATKSVSSVSGVSSVQCPDIDVVCGHTSQPFACKYGHWSDALQKCICFVGYSGDECATEDTALVAEAGLGDGVPDLIRHSSISVSGLTGTWAAFNGAYSCTSTNEGVEAFYSANNNGGTYVYYSRYYNGWLFGSTKGGLSRFLDCEQVLPYDNMPDITQCTEWITSEDGIESGVSISYGSSVCGADDSGGNGGSGNDSFYIGSNIVIAQIVLYGVSLMIVLSSA